MRARGVNPSRRSPQADSDPGPFSSAVVFTPGAGTIARMPTPQLKHNTYFDGSVQSIGFERHGRRATVGVIAPGTYHFGTDAPERMSVLGGELTVKTDATDWVAYPAGTAFEIAGRSGFDVRATQPTPYLCEFL